MAGELSADQVLEIAEQMERNAVRFYRKAAGTCDDVRVCRLFVDLARWERQHVRVFTEMRERLSDSVKAVQAGLNREPGRCVIDATGGPVVKPPLPLVFGDRESPPDEALGRWTKAEVLRMAIQKEKNTVSYFNNLKEFIVDRRDVQVIHAIIDEEERHMKLLTQSLEQASES